MVFINLKMIHPIFRSYFISPVDYSLSNLDYNFSTKILITLVLVHFALHYSFILGPRIFKAALAIRIVTQTMDLKMYY